MQISPFKLERYYALHEFKAKYMLSSSDCESLSIHEILEDADSGSLSLWNDLRLGYTETPGHPILRAEIASLYSGLAPDNVVVLAPQEGIFIALQSFLQPRDHVIAIHPAYQSLYELARSIGCEVTPWNLQAQKNSWRLDLSDLEGQIKPNTRLLVLNFPHNPTGYLPSGAEMDKIINLADKHGISIFCDEMYRYLEPDPSLRLPSICEAYSRGISLSGMSKAFGLPGLRIGWMAAQDKGLVERWLSLKDYTTICSSAPSEILALAALRKKGALLARNLNILRGNLEIAGGFFRKHRARFDWLPPKAGSVAFPRLLGEDTIETFCEEFLIQKNVMLVKGSLFDFPGNHFRLGLGRFNFSTALQLLDEFISSS